MKLKVLGSSSKGNCYLLQSVGETLVIEAGLKFQDVQKGLNFNMSSVTGLLVSHAHKDHSKYAEVFTKHGIDVYMSEQTRDKIELKGHRVHTLSAGEEQKIGNFTVLPFLTEHDCDGSMGFVVNHPDLGNLLFATDTYYLRYKFQNLNHIMIEANYVLDILQKNIDSGALAELVAKRTVKSHFELENLKEWLVSNGLSTVRNIVLIHLSDGNSDAKRFKKEVEELTFKTVFIADPGLEIFLNP